MPMFIRKYLVNALIYARPYLSNIEGYILHTCFSNMFFVTLLSLENASVLENIVIQQALIIPMKDVKIVYWSVLWDIQTSHPHESNGTGCLRGKYSNGAGEKHNIHR